MRVNFVPDRELIRQQLVRQRPVRNTGAEPLYLPPDDMAEMAAAGAIGEDEIREVVDPVENGGQLADPGDPAVNALGGVPGGEQVAGNNHVVNADVHADVNGQVAGGVGAPGEENGLGPNLGLGPGPGPAVLPGLVQNEAANRGRGRGRAALPAGRGGEALLRLPGPLARGQGQVRPQRGRGVNPRGVHIQRPTIVVAQEIRPQLPPPALEYQQFQQNVPPAFEHHQQNQQHFQQFHDPQQFYHDQYQDYHQQGYYQDDRYNNPQGYQYDQQDGQGDNYGNDWEQHQQWAPPPHPFYGGNPAYNHTPGLEAAELHRQFSEMMKIHEKDKKDRKGKKDKRSKRKRKRAKKDKDSSSDSSDDDEYEGKSVQEMSEQMLKKYRLTGLLDSNAPVQGESRVERYARRSSNKALIAEKRRVAAEKFNSQSMREQFELLNKIEDAVGSVVDTCEDLQLDESFDFHEQVKIKLAVLTTMVKTQSRTLTLAAEVGWQSAKLISNTTAGLGLNKDQSTLYSEAKKENAKEKKERANRGRGRGNRQQFSNNYYGNGYNNFNRKQSRGNNNGGRPYRGRGPGRGYRGGGRDGYHEGNAAAPGQNVPG